MAMENGKSALEQMNQILAQQESLIEQKKQELAEYRKGLEVYEAELIEKTTELKNAQEQLKADRSKFDAYKKSEEEKLSESWKKLHEYEENVQNSMEEVLKEKVLLQSKNMEQLTKEFETENSQLDTMERLNLNLLRESVGIPLVESDKVSEVPLKEEEDTIEIQEETTKAMPQLFNTIQAEVEKSFKMQKPFVLEKTPERLCMQLGSRELRVFDKIPYPEMNLVINYKNAKNDSKLQRTIASAARTTPDWIFETEQNQLVCRMFFKSDETPKNLIKKIKECIEKIEG